MGNPATWTRPTMPPCERCGRHVSTQIVETMRGEKQTARLCALCIEVVIKRNTNYQVNCRA